MPGGQPQVFSTQFRGLNRLLADYMLSPGESPDTADAGQYQDIAQKLGPRRGRKPIQSLPFPIRGVVPLNLSWLKLQLIATADGNITPFTITDPIFFNDIYSWLAFDPISRRYVTDGGGPYNVDGSANPLVNLYPTNFVSGNMNSITLNCTPSIQSINYAIMPVWSLGTNSVSGVTFTITNTGASNINVGAYAGALIINSPVLHSASLGPGASIGPITDTPSIGGLPNIPYLYTLSLAAGALTALSARFDMVYIP